MYAPREIVVPVDFSESSRAAAHRAAMIAKAFQTPLHLLHALEYPALMKISDYGIPPGIAESMHKEAVRRMSELESELAQEGLDISSELAEMDLTTAIRSAVEKWASTLVVMGTHGYAGLQHVFLGSIAEYTLRTVPCPTLTVKESDTAAREPIRRILYATDFSSHSKHAAPIVQAFAKRFGASVEIVHVFVHPFGPYGVPANADEGGTYRDEAERCLDRTLAEFEDAGVPASRRLFSGVPADVIAHRASELGADLVVMGTRGTTGLAHVFLGSNAERTLRGVHCSVLTAKEGDSS